MLSCLDCHDCGRPPTVVPIGSVTHNRGPHTQRLHLTTELSGHAGVCRPSPSPFIMFHRNDAACSSTSTVLHATIVLSDYLVVRRNATASCSLCCSTGCHCSMESTRVLQVVSCSTSTLTSKHLALQLLCQPFTYVNIVQKIDTPVHLALTYQILNSYR